MSSFKVVPNDRYEVVSTIRWQPTTISMSDVVWFVIRLSLTLNASFDHLFEQVQNDTLKTGQLNVTQQTYDDIVRQQLRELWTNYGKLEEIWFDGG